jgi:Uncharacterized conserved protein
MMGSPSDEPGRWDRETQHQVMLTKGYYLQTTEVTQGQWKAVMGNNPSYFSIVVMTVQLRTYHGMMHRILSKN